MHAVITISIVAVTAITSFIAFSNRALFARMLYNPYTVVRRNEWHRLLTHALVHSDYMHLLFNMYMLWVFGGAVEAMFRSAGLFGRLGSFLYLLMYILGIIFSGLPAMIKHRNNDLYNAVGASGAVSAVLFAFILLNPMAGLRPFFIPFNIPAWILGIVYLGVEVYLDKRNRDNIAHDAHYWGALFGLLYVIALDPESVLRFYYLLTQ